ncbi:class I SAM-dependent methyltransferase [Candidatus Bathyarchaeota archaeon]|nr:MAG: class I SAM-dependent methyltransferase [Candidatus Bathyarchaeota archaeon]
MKKARKFELDSDVMAHYESGVEKDRLLKDTELLEFHRTKQIISRYLPKKPATILDIGGGPGVYASWLGEMGHVVHLVDPMPLHLTQARQQMKQTGISVASISLGDARALEFPNEYADIVLMMGPLYHLTEKGQRQTALMEGLRVLKQDGLIFVAGISKFASALDGSRGGYLRDPDFMRIIQRDLKEGQHRNPGKHPRYFTTAYFHHPAQLAEEVREGGFHDVTIFAVEGFAWLLPDFEKLWSDNESRDRLLSLIEATETEPSLIGVSAHLLCVGQKKRSQRRPEKL